VSSVDEYTITVKLYFERVLQISQSTSQDTLVAVLSQPSLFIDEEHGLEVLEKNTTKSKNIPKQLKPSLAATLIVKVGKLIGEATAYGAMVSLILNWLLSFSLSQLWGMVNSLQIVVHFPLVNVEYPANAKLVFSYFIKIASFDMLPTDKINSVFFQFYEETAISVNLEEQGYDKRNFIENLGSLYYLYPLVGLNLVVLVLLRLIIACGFQRP